jgi:hypothetical protein
VPAPTSPRRWSASSIRKSAAASGTISLPPAAASRTPLITPPGTDQESALNFAMDLTPLVEDPSLSVTDYVLSLVDRFRGDVARRVDAQLPEAEPYGTDAT